LSVVHASAPAKVLVETAFDGTGSVVPAQTLSSGRQIRVYAISRDAANNFIANVGADWAVAKASGGVADSDLVGSTDKKSALFTAHKVGRGQIIGTFAGLAVTRSDTLTVIAGTPARLTPLAGTTPQSAPVRTAFPVNLAALVEDSSANPVGGVLVRFAAPVTGASGTFALKSDTAVFADLSGIARAPEFTANALSGSYTDSALVRGAVPGLFALSNGSGGVHHFTIVSASGGQIGTQRAQESFPLSISARDSLGNVASSFSDTVDLSSTGVLVSGGGTTSAFTSGVLNPWPVALKASGKYLLKVQRTGGTEAGASDTITVVNPAPEVTSVSPTNGHSGEVLPVVIKGSGFINGVTAVFLSDSHIASSVSVTSYTELTATLSIDSSAPPGPKDITVYNLPPGGGATSVPNGFIVGNNPPPTLTGISPAEGQQFQTLNVGLTGGNFLSAGATVVNFGSGITLDTVKVDSSSHLSVTITISALADTGRRSVTVSNRPPGGGTSLSVSFRVIPAQVLPPTLAAPVNGAANQPLTGTTLSWNAPASGGQSIPYQLQLSTTPTFDTPVELDSSGITITTCVLPGTLDRYRAYYWRVRVKLATGAVSSYSPARVFTTIPLRVPVAITVGFPVNPSADQYSSSDYRMVGIPGSPNVSLSTYFKGTPGADWTAYWDNGAASSYFVQYTNAADSTFFVKEGRGFWVLQRGPWSLSDSVKMMLPDTTGTLRVRLHAGWNIITNPFPFALAWAQVERANNITAPLYAFTGSGFDAQPSAFQSGVGYYFDNDTTTGGLSSLVIPYGGALARTTTASSLGAASLASLLQTVDSSSWRVDVALDHAGVSAGGGDRAAWFGVAAEARAGRDRFDFHKPRTFGALSQVIFDRPGWDSTRRAFASDIRPTVRAVEEWTLQVQTPGKALQQVAHTLRFSNIARVNERLAVYLVDRAHARYHDLRTASAYQFTPAGATTEFSVLVGDPAEVQKELERVGPKTFALDQNYPNPFNPATTIAVNVPSTANISVKIYNILGEEIRTVQEGPVSAGRYLFRWEGNNNHGALVGTGVYLCRMTVAGGPAFVRKMLLVK
jgi:hypothetical protein